MDSIDPEHNVKRTLPLAQLQEALQELSNNNRPAKYFKKLGPANHFIGNINIAKLEKKIVLNRPYTDCYGNADDLYQLWQALPIHSCDWTTAHVQLLIDSLAGKGEITPSRTQNNENTAMVRQVYGQLSALIEANSTTLGPLFDPHYCHCDFSNCGTDNDRGPPDGWMAYMARLRSPAGIAPAAAAGAGGGGGGGGGAAAAGGGVGGGGGGAAVAGGMWPHWQGGPPAPVNGSNSLYTFFQGTYIMV